MLRNMNILNRLRYAYDSSLLLSLIYKCVDICMFAPEKADQVGKVAIRVMFVRLFLILVHIQPRF